MAKKKMNLQLSDADVVTENNEQKVTTRMRIAKSLACDDCQGEARALLHTLEEYADENWVKSLTGLEE